MRSLARSFDQQTHFYFYQIRFFSAAGTSDHLTVISEIDDCLTKWKKEKTSFQKINKIDYESFHSDIHNSDLIKKSEKDLSGLCEKYDSVLSSTLDKYASVRKVRKPPYYIHG